MLQDDTVACPGFLRAARAAFEARPGRLIAFYHSTGPGGVLRRMEAALNACAPFFEFPMGRWVPTVALGWPVELAAEFLDWAANVRKVRDHWQTDDPLVGAWAHERGHGALATVPSLVEHPDDVPSYVKSHKGYGAGLPHRRAACWIGDVPVDRWLAMLP